MNFENKTLAELFQRLDDVTRERITATIERIVAVKKQNGKIVVATGSGPNIHEGATTLIAELIRLGVIDGVITSSAVIAHEMAGTLDRVKRLHAALLGMNQTKMPRGNIFEITLLNDDYLASLAGEMVLDMDLYRRAAAAEGKVIIKAAGNMAYPMGLRSERLALEIEAVAKTRGLPFEVVAGQGADPLTMIGAGARKGVPVLVSVTQLVGGGMVGLAVGDSISLKRRSTLIAAMLGEADLIIESGVALTQEIHDGPFETYTGHGIWSDWDGYRTYSLQDKTLVRIDLDQNLESVWQMERSDSKIQEAINQGLPKTKCTGVPFRMEMSGFARLEGSIPLIADLGVVWPLLAERVTRELGLPLQFRSYPQHTEEGRLMRDWIVENIKPVQKSLLLT